MSQRVCTALSGRLLLLVGVLLLLLTVLAAAQTQPPPRDGSSTPTVVSVQNFEIAALDRVSDFEEYLSFTVDEGQRLKKPLKARAGQVVLVRFELAAESGKVTSARQAFFAIRHPTQRESQVTIRANIVKGRFVGKLELTREVLVGNYLTEGEYHMVLIVGDPSFGNVISWDLGTLQLGLGSVVDDVPAPPSPPKALPEIHHIFQASDSKNVTVLPALFSGFLLAALVLLLILWKIGGADLGMISPSFSGKITTLLFFASLGSLLGLLVLFWFKLKLAQTLVGLLVVAPPTIFFGSRVLRDLAERSASSDPAQSASEGKK